MRRPNKLTTLTHRKRIRILVKLIEHGYHFVIKVLIGECLKLKLFSISSKSL